MDNESKAQEEESLRGPSLRRTLGLVTLAWVFGSVWVTAVAGAPLTLFARGLGASEFELGVLTALPFLAQLVSIPASVFIERTGERKNIFLWSLYLQRVMWFPIAFVPLWLLSRGAEWSAGAVSVFLLLMFVMHACVAVGGPAWVSWMADIVPERARGRYFSRRRQWGIVSAVPTALLVGWVLDGAAGRGGNVMHWCALIFFAAAVFGIADIALFHFVRHPAREPVEDANLVGLFKGPLRDRQFMLFAGFVATLTFAVSFMGQFVTLYMLEKLRINAASTQLMLLVAPLAAQLLVFGLWGRAVDRMGKRPVMALAAMGLVPVGIGWIFVNPTAPWLGYVLSGLGAALWAGVETANLNFVLEFSGTGNGESGGRGGSNYVAVNSVIVNLAGFLGGLASGAVAWLLRDFRWEHGIGWMQAFTFYELLFLISAALRLLAVGFVPFIHEPSAAPAGQTLRFMTANFYNNLLGAAQVPLRLVKQLRALGYRE